MSAAEVEPDPSRVGFLDLACPKCGWRFFTTGGLYEHLANDCRPVETNELACDLCGRRFTSPATRANHKLQKHGPRVRCAECGLESTRAGLSSHQTRKGHKGTDEL